MSAPRKNARPAAKAAPAKKPRPPTPAAPDSMSAEVIEFITAIDDYKRKHGRPFPSWSEVFDVLKGLGYRRTG